ncbi:MAG: hypothetical protein FWD71_08615 [Oscillospiraceae bacterium]|nr:hypothetical protein [Oscillospiraceae bacterium]
MSKTIIRIISAFLVFTLILVSFTACKNNGGGTIKETSASDPANSDSLAGTGETTAEITDSLPDGLNFNGATINIYHFGSDDTKDYDAMGEMGGDIVLDAVYQRNRDTEERLNVKLNWIAGSSDWDQFPNQVNTAMLAGVSDYDLIMEENSRAFQHTLRGYFVNLTDAQYIDLDQPWWYSKMMDEGSIDNKKRYYITGALNMTTLFGASAVFFNKGIYSNYFGDVSDIYNHVLDGTWTDDVFAQYCKGVYTDLNGNQLVDEGDMFGFEFEQWGIPNYMSMSTGLSYSTRDADGLPVMDLYTDQTIAWSEMLYRLLYTDNMSILGDKKTSFADQRNLFYVGTLGDANTLRASFFAYGILPYPKLSESLDYMSGAATANGNAIAVPVSAPSDKFDATCAVAESLCADAYKNVVPVWYDTALKIKYLDAEIDAQMVDIIYGHINSPFIMMADKEMGIGSIFTNAIFGAKTSSTFTSYYQKNEGSLQSKWDKMIATYLALGN